MPFLITAVLGGPSIESLNNVSLCCFRSRQQPGYAGDLQGLHTEAEICRYFAHKSIGQVLI